MNITRENLGDLDLSIKIEITESDYAERVAKQLKDYQHKATVPGFRKGMAPMALIQRMYKTSVVADEVQNLLGESLYKYIDDEKLDIIGSPLSNDEKTGEIDFTNADYTFYFDAALMPQVDIKWNDIKVKHLQVTICDKDVDRQVDDVTKRYGKFVTPETIEENNFVYGKVVELDANGAPKEGGVSSFTSFELSDIQDDAIRAQFLGKKSEDKVVFNAKKAFSATNVEKHLHLDSEMAKNFDADVEFSISGSSCITPHDLNEELFEKVFPGKDVKDLDTFKKLLAEEMEKANNEQCNNFFVSEVQKALIDQFNVTVPEAFLKRWILSRKSEGVTAESIETSWAENYLPALKWEITEVALSKIKAIEPTPNEIVDYIKSVLRTHDVPAEGEDEKAIDARLEQSARTIASNKENVKQIMDKLTNDKLFGLFNEQIKPEEEKLTLDELVKRMK